MLLPLLLPANSLHLLPWCSHKVHLPPRRLPKLVRLQQQPCSAAGPHPGGRRPTSSQLTTSCSLCLLLTNLPQLNSVQFDNSAAQSILLQQQWLTVTNERMLVPTTSRMSKKPRTNSFPNERMMWFCNFTMVLAFGCKWMSVFKVVAKQRWASKAVIGALLMRISIAKDEQRWELSDIDKTRSQATY